MSVTKIFVFLAVIFGCIFIFINPPFNSPDEHSHFYRAYAVSQGNIYPEAQDGELGSQIPIAITDAVSSFKEEFEGDIEENYSYEEMSESFSVPVDKNQTEFVAYPTAAEKAIFYLVPATGIFVSEIVADWFNPEGVDASATQMLYFARIFTLMAYIIIIAYAIKITPILKKSFCVIALMPMSLYLGSSVHYDALIIPTAIFTLAYIFRLCHCEDVDRVNVKDIVILSICGFILLNLKTVYVVTFIPFLFIPKEKIGVGKEKAKKYLLLVTIALLPTVITSLMSNYFVPEISKPDSLAGEQIRFILLNPFEYISILFNTIRELNHFYIQTTIGVFGWLDTYMPTVFYFMFIVGAVCIFFADMNTNLLKFGWKNKLLCAIGILSALLVIFTAQYVFWTPVLEGQVGTDVVQGVQGRYFIPLLPLIPVFFSINYVKKNEIFLKANNLILSYAHLLSICILAISTVTLLARFWL